MFQEPAKAGALAGVTALATGVIGYAVGKGVEREQINQEAEERWGFTIDDLFYADELAKNEMLRDAAEGVNDISDAIDEVVDSVTQENKEAA